MLNKDLGYLNSKEIGCYTDDTLTRALRILLLDWDVTKRSRPLRYPHEQGDSKWCKCTSIFVVSQHFYLYVFFSQEVVEEEGECGLANPRERDVYIYTSLSNVSFTKIILVRLDFLFYFDSNSKLESFPIYLNISYLK